MSEWFRSQLSWLRYVIVYSTIFLFLLLNLVHIPFLVAGSVTPFFLLMGIYFWTLLRPSLMPPLAIFLLGFLLDLASGGIVGVNALSFLVVALVVHNQKRFLRGQSWPVTWVGYVLAILICASLQYIIYALVHLDLPPLDPLLRSIVVSGLLYPLAAWPLFRLNRVLSLVHSTYP